MTKTTIDDIEPKFHKAWNYANDFMYTAIKNEHHCERFLAASTEHSTKWTEEEKEFLTWAWVLITSGHDTFPSYVETPSDEATISLEEANAIIDSLYDS